MLKTIKNENKSFVIKLPPPESAKYWLKVSTRVRRNHCTCLAITRATPSTGFHARRVGGTHMEEFFKNRFQSEELKNGIINSLNAVAGVRLDHYQNFWTQMYKTSILVLAVNNCCQRWRTLWGQITEVVIIASLIVDF